MSKASRLRELNDDEEFRHRYVVIKEKYPSMANYDIVALVIRDFDKGD